MNDIDKTVIGEQTQMIDPQRTQMGGVQMENATHLCAANVDCPVCHSPNPPSEKYCMDCGFLLTSAPATEIQVVASYSKLISVDGTVEFALKAGENTIGRENCDVLLTHNSVSRKHAKISIENDKAYAEDLGSTNGTYVNGSRLNSGDKTELTDGCELVFGSSTFKYEAAEVASEQEIVPDEPSLFDTIPECDSSEPVEQETDAEVILEETSPDATIAGRLVSKDGAFSYDLSIGVNTIGRRAGANDIVLADPYCSGRHADLSTGEGKFILTDIGSTNGSLVNGVRLEPNVPREVLPDDEITLGRTIFKIEVA